MSFGRLYNHQESRFQSRYAMNNPIAPLPVVAATQDIAQAQPSCLEIRGKKNEVRWDNTAAVTTRGALVYFAQFLDTTGVFDRLVAGSPLEYASNNAPEPRDVLGTLLLSVLSGHRRYAQVNELRQENVLTVFHGMGRTVSEDSARKAFGRGGEGQWLEFLEAENFKAYEPLLQEPYVLDLDMTVVPLYGHQQGAEVSYNPAKPGRPSRNIHAAFIGALRLVVGTEVLRGKEQAPKHSLPKHLQWLRGLPPGLRPEFVRGDIAYGTEGFMSALEQEGVDYLFKVKMTKGGKELCKKLESPDGRWQKAGQGWEGAQSTLRLDGWSATRRCILLRRQGRKPKAGKVLPGEFEFVLETGAGPQFEYALLVTNTEHPIETLAQCYRDRADCENVFDEMKNQWGWGGFMTHDLQRPRVMTAFIALVYNLWNVFSRLADPTRHMEAVTTRPLLMTAVGRLVRTGRRQVIHLTSPHALCERIRKVLEAISRFLGSLRPKAEQLSLDQVWRTILSVAFVKWLGGRMLQPALTGSS